MNGTPNVFCAQNIWIAFTRASKLPPKNALQNLSKEDLLIVCSFSAVTTTFAVIANRVSKSKDLVDTTSKPTTNTMAVDPNTGEIIPKGKSPRFLLWLSFFVFATITLGSAVSLVSRYFASQ